MRVLAPAPVPSEVRRLIAEAGDKLDLTNVLLTAVGVLLALIAVLLAVAALAGIAAAKAYVERWSEAVAERIHSAPIARVLNSLGQLEWQRVRGFGPSKEDVMFLAHSALRLLESSDQPDPDLLAAIKNNLAYYYVDFDYKEQAEIALRYTRENLDRFSKVTDIESRRRSLEWLETYAFVHSRLLTCDQIHSEKLREKIQQWMERYEPIRELLAEHLSFIDKKCPGQAQGTSRK